MLLIPYVNINAWYWAVAGSTTQVYSSAAGTYIPVTDPAYQALVQAGFSASLVSTEQALWDLLVAEGQPLPAGAATSDAAKNARIAVTDMVQFQVLFNHENRIRTLEGKAAITVAQFKTGVKALLP